MTPAEVTGDTNEHLTLLGHHPAETNVAKKSWPDHGYVVTGDKVDLVTTCEGFAYVRFHGSNRVSTGWVDASRIKADQPARVPLPANAAALCKAAEATLNRGAQLERLSGTPMTPATLEKLKLDVGWNASAPDVAHFTVNGRALAATSIDSGGTCHSTEVRVLNGNLTADLSPADREDRDVENQGSDSWGFGVSEELVMVNGQPMVLSYDTGSTSFHLSLIDKSGDIIPTCEGDRVDLEQRQLVTSHDDRVCHAVLAGQQTPVALQPPTSQERLSLAKPQDDFVAPSARFASHDPTKLEFHDTSDASQVEYQLTATGDVDMDNSGKPRRVGLVSFFNGNSTASCGGFQDTQFLPVYLDEHGNADPSADANQPLVKALPHGMSDGTLSTVAGKTFLELSTKNKGLSSAVWKIDANGASQVCEFQLTHIVVNPISG